MYLGNFVISIGAGWLDSSGGVSNLEVVNGESTDECEVACKNVTGCVGFTFVSQNKKCDLKNIQQAVTLVNGMPLTIISGSIQFIGDEQFCTSFIPCGENEGDCDPNFFDSDKECLDGLYCGYNNCPASLSFDLETDCCSRTQITSHNYPNNYDIQREETWLLTQESATFVNLEFVAFNVSIFYTQSVKIIDRELVVGIFVFQRTFGTKGPFTQRTFWPEDLFQRTF